MSEGAADQTQARQRVSLVDVVILSWIRPARTASHLNELALSRAFAIHVVSALAAVGVIIVLVAIEDMRSYTILDGVVEILDDFAGEWRRYPFEISLAVVGSALGIEAAFFGFALGVTPWGARDERLRDSYRHALRQTWLRTPQVVLVILLMGSSIVGLELSRRLWQPPPIPANILPVEPVPPRQTGDAVAYQKALSQYWVNFGAYHRELQKVENTWRFQHRVSRPWYADEPELILIPVGAALVLWFFWAYLRAVGVERHVPPMERPPTCEACGYNLTTMPMEARCPECGRSVIESLGPDVRRGAPWSRRVLEEGCALDRASWFTTAVGAIRDPAKLGAQLCVTTHETGHRALMVRALPVVFLIGAGSLFTLALIESPGSPFVNFTAMSLMICTVFGSACMLGTIGFALQSALIVGLYQTWRYKRNLLPASMQAAGYLTGYLVVWSAFGAVSILVFMHLDRTHFFIRLENVTGIYRDFLMVLIWFFPNMACALGYLVLVARATAAARYANR